MGSTQKGKCTRDTMREKGREKHNDLSTGPDFYFEKALQYPEFSSSSSSFQGHINRRFVLLPSSIKVENNASQYSNARYSYDRYNNDDMPYDCMLSSTRHSWPPVTKDLRNSPDYSPGSNATSKTSLCTDDEYKEDDDLESYCGSLCYSVESWTVGHYQQEDIDEGYHAEDEDDDEDEDEDMTTTALGHSSYSLDNIDYDCVDVDPCFQPLGWLQALIKEMFRQPGSFEDVRRPLTTTME